MNTIAFAPQQDIAGGNPRVVPQPAARPAAPVAQPAAAPRADRVQMNGDVNPYEGFADDFTRVTVDRWRKGPNDSIERILRNQGYSSNDIYKKDKNGQSLIQRVAAANGLKDPNLIRPGQKGLMVPVKDKPEAPKTEAPKTEVPKTEAPKTEVPPQVEAPADKPEAVKPPVTEEAKPEAAQTEEAAPAKPRRRFPWFRRREKAEVPAQTAGPATTAPEVPAANTTQPPATTATTTQPPATGTQEPGTDPASIAAAEASEVNLLMKGVTDGKFTRNEFMALNATANQYTELRSQYAKDGFKPDQMVELSQVQAQYGSMYGRFLADDKAKITFSGGDSPDPAARIRAQQNEQGGQYYDQFVNRQIDEATIKARLLAQRQASSGQ